MKKLIKKILSKFGFLEIAQRFHPVHIHYRISHLRKERTILSYQKKFHIDTLVETGTYTGQMVDAMKHRFKKIYSIELGKDLYEQARARFKDEAHVTLLQGDSGKLLGELLASCTEPYLFWLDAHYSSGITARGQKDTPIMQELETIFNHPIHTHVILIDDARLFLGTQSYPTIVAIEKMVSVKKYKYQIDVTNDIIRIVPIK